MIYNISPVIVVTGYLKGNRMIRNKEIIKMAMIEIKYKLEFIQDLNKYNQAIGNIVHSGLNLMEVLKDELEK